jgi:hypothetical protein
MKLYEIEKELELVLFSIEMQDGVPDAEDTKKIEELSLAFDQKMEGIAKHILNLQIEADACKTEAKRIAERGKAAEKKIEGYEHYLQTACPDGGTFGNRKIKWRASEAVKLLVDDNAVPDQYKRVKIVETVTVDKAGIKADLKNGAELMFAEIEKRKNLKVE